MTTTLRFGRGQSVSLSVEPQRLVADCSQPQLPPVANIRQAVDKALQEPLQLPPLSRMVVPGDRVTLAVSRSLAGAAAAVESAVTQLAAGGIQLKDVTLLVERRSAWIRHLPAEIQAPITVTTHQPDDSSQLCYLAASARDEPIYLHRALCDADLVVPIGALQLDGSLGYLGVAGQIFPTFSDRRQLRRFRAPRAAHSAKSHQELRREAEQVLWLLGVTFTVQGIPAGGNGLLGVLAGKIDAVEQRGQGICQKAWHFSIPQRASLAIAALSGGPHQQTWQNIARTVSAVLPAVEDDGVIAICSDVRHQPGPAIKQLVDAASLDRAQQAIQRQRSADAIAAEQLARALQRVRIYLLSRLDEEIVEDLGLTPVSDPQELVTLAHRHKNCLLVGNAQHTRVEVNGTL